MSDRPDVADSEERIGNYRSIILGDRWCEQVPPSVSYDYIPLLGGSEESRQFKGTFTKETFSCDSRITDEVGEQADEAIHLRPTSHGTPETLVQLACLLLLLALSRPGLPVMSDRFSRMPAEVQ